MEPVSTNQVPEEEGELPFGPPLEEYLYRCSACGEEWLVDDVIVDAAVGMAKFRGEYEGKLPSLGCPGCNGDTLEYVDD
jgi:hypothetical protein